MYGSVIFHIVGVDGREAAPFLDFPAKLLSTLLLLCMADMLMIHCVLLLISTSGIAQLYIRPLHSIMKDCLPSFIVWGMMMNSLPVSLLFFDAPFAGGYDVLCPRKILKVPSSRL